MSLALWEQDFGAVEALQQVEHGPVLVLEEPPRDRDVVVRSDCNEVLVECAVVNRAETQPVRDGWLSEHIGVTRDVSRIQ